MVGNASGGSGSSGGGGGGASGASGDDGSAGTTAIMSSGSDAGLTSTGVTTGNVVEWRCHLHPDTACKIRYLDGMYHHYIEVTRVSHQQVESMRIVEDRYYVEPLGRKFYIGPIDVALSFKRQPGMALKNLFRWLDDNRLKYKPDDAKSFVERFAVVSLDDSVAITMQNKLVLSAKPQEFYTTTKWMISLLKTLFPKISDLQTDPSTPQWAAMEWINCQNQNRLRRRR